MDLQSASFLFVKKPAAPKRKVGRPRTPLTNRLYNVHLRVTGTQLESWKAAALADHRSLSNWIAVQLDRAVESERGEV